jgi:hypothetical protein
MRNGLPIARYVLGWEVQIPVLFTFGVQAQLFAGVYINQQGTMRYT